MNSESHKSKGYALMMVLIMTCVATLSVGGILQWSKVNSDLTARNNEYFTSAYAAEGATEKLLIRLSRDYQSFGEPIVYSKLASYANNIPTAADDPYWSDYQFSSASGVINKTLLSRSNPTNWVVLGPPYQGLRASASTYQIISNAKRTNASAYGMTAAVGQEINLGTIPIFQFAIFYQQDMEINPGAAMTINGVVHGNQSIYLQPDGRTLTFNDDVSGSGNIMLTKKPGDPGSRSPGTVIYNKNHFEHVSPLNLPVGTNLSGGSIDVDANVHAILDIPPYGEALVGAATNRLYNQADLILLITPTNVIAKSGVKAAYETLIPTNEWKLFLDTNNNFYNMREGINVKGAALDIGKLGAWNATNNTLRPNLYAQGISNVSTVYIADTRSLSNSSLATNYLILTNYTIITNTTPAVSLAFPADGTYLGTVNNTTSPTNCSPPAPAAPPAMNIVTNTTLTTNATYPAAGTYIGSVTTKSGKYIYNKITSYNYKLPAYAYSLITGVSSNASYTTNKYYTTNWIAFGEPGISLVNGATLLPDGLTIATDDPVYIVGNYNTSANGTTFTTGTTNTANTKPASIMSDAITVLSGAWNNANSSLDISSRVATDTTVNAAFLSGNVPTGVNTYSGGVENFPRFLENWSGKTFTYNGSMVVMFSSRVAVAPWGGANVYNPPTRNWSFDRNFLDAAKQPPSTPRVLSITRGRWSIVAPNSTSF